MPIQRLIQNPAEFVELQNNIPPERFKFRSIAPLHPNERYKIVEAAKKIPENINIILGDYEVERHKERQEIANCLKSGNVINLFINVNFFEWVESMVQKRAREIKKEKVELTEPDKKMIRMNTISPFTLFTILHRLGDIINIYRKKDWESFGINLMNVNSWTGRSGLFQNKVQAASDLFARWMMGHRTNHLIHYKDDEDKIQKDTLINELLKDIWDQAKTNALYSTFYRPGLDFILFDLNV